MRPGGQYHMNESSIAITTVDSKADRPILRNLLVEFHEWMVDHAGDLYDSDAELTEDFQSLEEESASWAWIARFDGALAGCVLLYGVTDDLAEFKRLWVRPAHRGNGIGQALTQTVVDEARAHGYETLGLTTPPWGEAAQALYKSMGFERTPPYSETRLPEKHHDDAIFMQLDLLGAEQNTTNL